MTRPLTRYEEVALEVGEAVIVAVVSVLAVKALAFALRCCGVGGDDGGGTYLVPALDGRPVEGAVFHQPDVQGRQ